MSTDFDVVVVGYGPTGQVLASMLGRAGHRVGVFERWPALYGLPRLTHIDGETARVIAAAGDVGYALRDASPAAAYEWRNGSGDLLIALDWTGAASGYAAHYTMYQPDIEDSIDQRARTYAGVEINQGTGVVALAQFDDHVAVTVRPWSRDRDDQWSAGMSDRTVTARYVVGADGANSVVRTALGIDRSDLGVDDMWLNIDTECLRDLGPAFKVTQQFCDPLQPNMFMPIGNTRQRFEVAVRDGDDPAEMETEEFAWRWLRERHGLGPEDVRILRHVIYRFSARTADKWRDGRVLLAGDAAHTMPPYMGQGACSGMRDGITLAWKLDLVLTGKADDSLLDTYEAERRPHVDVIQHCAVELGRVANLKDPQAAAARDDAFRRGEVPPLPPFPTITAGVIATADRVPSGVAGRLGPHGVVTRGDDRALFDDLFGWGFTVMAADDPATVLSAQQLDFLASIGARVATIASGTTNSTDDVDGAYARFFADNEVQAYIERPDFHLFGAGSMADLPGLVDQLASAFGARESHQLQGSAQ
ncbi:bifunctional 3-(3-hydroxy-phenyl)propionate/3-hydroxycinnamic acid hydroxylase [Gordonia sp. TBRC 11910]|uniref:Bifunctional 3-(3-hydroxy-phenyl)propionate/3-hydroxycinnamic acid hydroxylase n=1 Tax=Gordonia asplenii TaxID=2725283 RepID=A0A848KRX5_9ACTN|nr:bifunctional 3-(3-hydroxy-phenyl)propionate/3-hydroxycinnamic acid hydroxylase [Gordonia asplenii]NMO00707.1 bifunctional 3-(3-hydroxy-phenyl)propionate/3-hydroxycinnamic acid hydroxylase [Gordonia asplenii]